MRFKQAGGPATRATKNQPLVISLPVAKNPTIKNEDAPNQQKLASLTTVIDQSFQCIIFSIFLRFIEILII